MRFLADRKQWLRVSGLTTLAGALWAGVALAEPPGRLPPPAISATPVDDLWPISGDPVGEYLRQLERHLD